VYLYENLAVYAAALQRFDEARQIIHEAQARNMDDFGLHQTLYALAFLGADTAAMVSSNSGLPASPSLRTLDWHGHPTPKRTAAISARRGN
jgi:hypothetical protein